MADAMALLLESFHQRLSSLFREKDYLLGRVDDEQARELGRRAAETVFAPLAWSEAVGDRWSTTEAAEFLDVTRQALHDRLKRGTLLGVPGRGVTWFPTWQFDIARREVRPVVASMLRALRQLERPLEPVEIAAWAQQPRSDLDDLAPADWIAAENADEQVLAAARRTASHLQA